MRKQAVGSLKDPPNGSALVWVQMYDGAGAWQSQMVAVETAQANIIEFIVVFAHESFAALVVVPEPGLESFLNFLLLVTGGFCGRHVHHIAIGVRVVIIHRGCAQIKCV